MLYRSHNSVKVLLLVVAASITAISQDRSATISAPPITAATFLGPNAVAENNGPKGSDAPAVAGPSETPASGVSSAKSTSNPWASEASSTTSAETANPSNPTNTTRSIWIWQGDDDRKVQVKTKQPRGPRYFDPLADSGFGFRLSGEGRVGYSSEMQELAPTYGDFNGGITLNSTGFVYSPRLLSYELSTSYDRSNLGLGERDATMNGLGYGGRVFVLQATPMPFSVSFLRNSQQFDGTLSTPFDYESRSTEIAGSVLRLPVSLNYRFGTGAAATTNTAGYDLDYRYRSGDVAIRKKWAGFGISLTDNYLRGKTLTNGDDRTQTTNYLRLNADRSFGSRVTLFVDGNLSKYKVDENRQTSSTDANVSSLGAGVDWHVTDKLSTAFHAQGTRNAVNMLQLLAQSTGTSLPNPLPGVTQLDTRALSLDSTTSYRATQHWTFGANANYTTAELPPSLVAAIPAAQQPRLTSTTRTASLSAAYSHRVWKFNYTGSGTGGVQSYDTPDGRNGAGTTYTVTNDITGGHESRLLYGVRFTMDRTRNPVFFDLLESTDRIADFDFSSRGLGFMRLSGKVEYRDREIGYAGSRQNQSGINFLVTATVSRLDISAGRTTTDANQRFFGLLSPLLGSGASTGVTPPLGLLTPQLFSSSKTDMVEAAWRPVTKLRINSRYMRMAYTVTGQSRENLERLLDNNVQYSLGRFDIIGGFVYSAGDTGSSHRRVNRFYFRIKFPFQLW